MKRNIREKLKEKDIKITELADYLNITRPTLYKFIEIFDSGKRKGIDPTTLKVFLFIEKYPLCGKVQIINYLINLIKSGNTKTEAYSNRTAFSNVDASIIKFLENIDQILENKEKTKEDIEKIKIYNEFLNKINGGN